MPLSTAAKAALCICPPALLAGTVATVPSVKRAVHHVTAPHHAPKAAKRVADKGPTRPQVAAEPPEDCGPGLGGPAVPLVTYAEPIADEPGGGGGLLGGAAPLIGALGVGGGGGGVGTPVAPVSPGAGAIPEPPVWLMMIAGVGTLGAALRRRRRVDPAGRIRHSGRKAAAGSALWSGSAAVEAGDMATTVAVKSAVASAAGKVMLCVCPAAIVAGSAMTVPPLRQAVYAYTMPTEPIALAPPSVTSMAQPCETMTVPVAATAVDGFPASVQTTPAARAPAAATTVADGETGAVKVAKAT